MRVPARLLALLLTVLATAQCSVAPLSHAPAPRLANLPIVVTVPQRSTTVLPHSGGAVRLTIDDITRGQVMVTLLAEDGGVLLGATSLVPGRSARFRLGEEAYQVTLKGLQDALLDEDFGTFEVSAATAGRSEQARIERLLEMVASLDGAVFLWNGAEHSPRAAADHLRAKWKRAEETVPTAEAFIDRIATRSFTSGEAYRIRLPDGTVILACAYLRGRLAEIEKGG